jgi:hypothetical protein
LPSENSIEVRIRLYQSHKIEETKKEVAILAVIADREGR